MNKQFTSEDQELFSELSGDYNPVHTDPLEARRLMFGGVVVHGVHLLLWSLDQLFRGDEKSAALRSVNCVFESGVRVEDTVTCEIERPETNEAILRVRRGGDLVARAQVTWHPTSGGHPGTIPTGTPLRRAPAELAASDLDGLRGRTPLSWCDATGAKLFPELVKRIPRRDLAVVVATTRIVGMECPGLHSVFSELRLTFEEHYAGVDDLGYEVTRYDPRFRLATLRLDADGVGGELRGFLRPIPTAQPDAAFLGNLVSAGAFSGQRALVVGGSRGLGETASKLIALGGGDVRLTYHRGSADASEVCDDIRSQGGSAEPLPYDVVGPIAALATGLGDWRPTHLYYFATPFIFQASRSAFSVDLFHRFVSFYVDGFERTFSFLNQGELKGVLYPSSVALDENPMGMSEYIAAKQAGETLCHFFSRTNKNVVFLVPRLPRLATDQTASVLTVPSADPGEVMLGYLKQMP